MTFSGRIFGHHSRKTKKSESSQQYSSKAQKADSATTQTPAKIALSTVAAGVGSKFDSGNGFPSSEPMPTEETTESKPKKKSFFSRAKSFVKKLFGGRKKSDSKADVLVKEPKTTNADAKAATLETKDSSTVANTATDPNAPVAETKDSADTGLAVSDPKAETAEAKDTANTVPTTAEANNIDSSNLAELNTEITDLKVELATADVPYIAGSTTLFTPDPQTLEEAKSQKSELEALVAMIPEAEAKSVEKDS